MVATGEPPEPGREGADNRVAVVPWSVTCDPFSIKRYCTR
jgi:hypothetical protein